MSVGEYPLPVLNGIACVPILRGDGTVMTTPGYDQTTGLYDAPDPNLHLPDIPDEPTAENVRVAVDFIEAELFADFPFSVMQTRLMLGLNCLQFSFVITLTVAEARPRRHFA